MSAQVVGYARTSTVDQKAGLEAQERDLRSVGAETLFVEQTSSVGHRPKLEEAIAYVRKGDTFVVTKIDRLARSVIDLNTIAKRLQAKGVHLRILGSDGLDTSTSNGRLVLNLLGSIAEFEREIMLERQREGIAKAQREGKYKGRAPTAMAKRAEVVRLASEGMTKEAIAKRLGIGVASVYRALKAQASPETGTAA